MTHTARYLSQFILAGALAVGATSAAIADNDENPFTGYWHAELDQDAHANMDAHAAKSAPIAQLARREAARPSGAFWDNEGAEDSTASPQPTTHTGARGAELTQRSPFSDYEGD